MCYGAAMRVRGPLVLRFEHVAPGRPFHAAFISLDAARDDLVSEHAHDFHELLLVLSGIGTHVVNGEATELRAGGLHLVRPPDFHAVQPALGAPLRFINVAFPSDTWAAFAHAATLSVAADAWEAAARPPSVLLHGAALDLARRAFRAMLAHHVRHGSGLELCRFLLDVLPLLSEPRAASPAEPRWLTRAANAMKEPSNLRGGLRRFVTLSGVSAEHLARSMRAHRDTSPTEFVNTLRLEHAAHLLTTTNAPILDVTDLCGFESVSYFYRLFTARYGRPPSAYRRFARRSVAP